MESVSPVSVEQSYFEKNSVEKQKPAANQQVKDGDKKLKYALIGLGVLGGTGIVIGSVAKGKIQLKKAQGFFDQLTKTISGNNKIISEEAGKNQKEVQKLLDENPEMYSKIKEYVKSVLHPVKLDEITQEGLLYHGTSIDSAASILQEGITPYATKSGSAQGIGRGIYTTPTLDLAKQYSNDGVILPYKLKGNIAQLNIKDIDFRAAISYQLSKILEPDAKDTLFYTSFSPETNIKASELTADTINKAMQDLGYSALYTPVGGTVGLFSSLCPAGIDKAGQIAIFDGTKLELDKNKLREINPVTNSNKKRFLEILKDKIDN